MRAELAKALALPTPRNLALTLLGLELLVAIGLAIDGPAQSSDYEDAMIAIASLGTSIAAIVLGVWIVAVEYGQGTMRRTLAADPRRVRVLATKLALGLSAVALGTAALYVTGWLMGLPAGAMHGSEVRPEEMWGEMGASLVSNTAYAGLAFAVALLARSMAGGIAITIVAALVVDALLTAIPTFGDYTFGANVAAVTDAVTGAEPAADANEAGVAVPVVLAWLTVLNGLAWARFAREDVR